MRSAVSSRIQPCSLQVSFRMHKMAEALKPFPCPALLSTGGLLRGCCSQKRIRLRLRSTWFLDDRSKPATKAVRLFSSSYTVNTVRIVYSLLAMSARIDGCLDVFPDGHNDEGGEASMDLQLSSRKLLALIAGIAGLQVFWSTIMANLPVCLCPKIPFRYLLTCSSCFFKASVSPKP